MKLGHLTPTVKSTIEQPFSLVASMEAIAFQKNNPAGPEFEALFIRYMDLVDKGISAKDINSDKEMKLEFNTLSRKHFGINAQLHTNSHLAATLPNVYVSHSSVVRDALRDHFKFDPSGWGQDNVAQLASGSKLGTVNTETAKVTGWFSEQSVPFFLNFNDLVNDYKLSSAEITAIALHEFGHDFNGIAGAVRFNQTNQVISDVVRHITDKGRGGDKEYIYRELMKLDEDISKETVEGLMSGDAVVMGVSAFRTVQGIVTTLSGSSVYNRNSYEALSDSFATRMGYGAPLATGLERLGRTIAPWQVFGEVMMLVSVVGLITSLLTMFKVLLAGKIGFYLVMGILMNSMSLYMVVNNNRVTTGDYEYDAMNDRINRIRQNVIEQLKDPEIDMKSRRAILEQLTVITEAQKGTINTPRPLREILKVIFSSDRMNERSIKAQQAIEKLIANDIFVSANKLASKA